jgi:hypothetical protein
VIQQPPPEKKVRFDSPEKDGSPASGVPLLPILEDPSASSSSGGPQDSLGISSGRDAMCSPQSRLDEQTERDTPEDEDPDQTLEYFSDISPGWMTFLTATSVAKTRNESVIFEADFDYVSHAISDARRVLLASETEGLAWTSSESMLVVPCPFELSSCFYYDFINDHCFSVTQEDFLTEDDVINYFPYVEEADRKEVSSFVNFEVFKLDLAERATNTVDAVWVRKWISRNPPVVKSRCCGRGFLDSQKKGVGRHSSTASMLSHRLAMTFAAQNNWIIEGFDVHTAFLQGLRFSEIQAKAQQLGIEIREQRQVWLRPPANMWRHLRALGFCTVNDVDRMFFVLTLLKALYGLVDGPLLFQLAFLDFFVVNLGFRSSLHDENFLFISDTEAWKLSGIIILHVDDALVLGSWNFIRWVQSEGERRFGKMK